MVSASFTQPIGYSSGALALSDFQLAIAMLRGSSANAIELSALRLNELAGLVAALPSLDLDSFVYKSFHAPSRFSAANESDVLQMLYEVHRLGWPIVIHPDCLYSPQLWRQFGGALCIENMDKRKAIGRTAAELELVFREYPEASFCLDLGHARQVDPTMMEARTMLRRYSSKIRQLHVSEVNTASRHDRLSWATTTAFREVAPLIPAGVAWILETPVAAKDIEGEMGAARNALQVEAMAAS